MGIAELSLEWWGANLVVTVCNYFPYILPASRLQADCGTTLIVNMQNYLCHQIGVTIEPNLPKHCKSFKQYVKGWRGVTAWIERPGKLASGNKMRWHSGHGSLMIRFN